MYTHIDAMDHKNIAGIAYLQTRLQEIYPNVKIDGMLGDETLLAFRSALKDSFHLHDHGFSIEGTGIGCIQKLIMQAVQATGPAKFATAGLHDAQWGKDTKAAIDYILDPQIYTARFKAITEELEGKPRPASKLSKRVLSNLRNRVDRHTDPAIPLVYDASNKLKEGVHWCTGEEFEVNKHTDLMLAKALNHENAVITIHQLLAAGRKVALHYFKGRPVGIIVLAQFRPIPCKKDDPMPFHVVIDGIWINSSKRGMGFGTVLLCAVKFKAEKEGWSRIVFMNSQPSPASKLLIAGNIDKVRDRIFKQLTTGHRYREVFTPFDESRPERCVLDVEIK